MILKQLKVYIKNMNKLKIKIPKDETGKEYFLPVVVENKAFLKGFLLAYNILASTQNLSLKNISVCLSSIRFNDILFDDTRIGDLSRPQIKEKLKVMIGLLESEHPDNDDTIYDDYVLTLSCNGCGMFFGFDSYASLPEEDFSCSCCGRKLVLYTNKQDDVFEIYDESKVIVSIMGEIFKELEENEGQ